MRFGLVVALLLLLESPVLYSQEHIEEDKIDYGQVSASVYK